MTTTISKQPVLRAFDDSLAGIQNAKMIGDFATTTRCNARCLGCYTDAGTFGHLERDRLKREFLDESQWLGLLEQLHPHIRTLVISGLGDLTFDRWALNRQIIDAALNHGLQVCIFVAVQSVKLVLSEFGGFCQNGAWMFKNSRTMPLRASFPSIA